MGGMRPDMQHATVVLRKPVALLLAGGRHIAQALANREVNALVAGIDAADVDVAHREVGGSHSVEVEVRAVADASAVQLGHLLADGQHHLFELRPVCQYAVRVVLVAPLVQQLLLTRPNLL